MPDRMQRTGGSLIQHGPDNDRIYLMHLDRDDLPELLDRMQGLAAEKGYSKIFCKVDPEDAPVFLADGYIEEARIPPDRMGAGGLVFVSRFLDPRRAVADASDRIQRVIEKSTSAMPAHAVLRRGYSMATIPIERLDEVAALYGDVFESYPFPIHDPGFLRECAASHVRYFGVLHGERIVAVSSAEQDREARRVEMTDFATLSEHRGKGLGRCLLTRMDQDMTSGGLRLAYTIARALSPGMNLVFARCGYRFAGTLVNNTDIGGRLESMNVWYRYLSSA